MQNALIQSNKGQIQAIKHGMTEQQWAIYDAEISVGLLKLRTAYPTQARNYSANEHEMLMIVWLEAFAGLRAGVFCEAVAQFIATDRKGFFPSPGQIMGIAVQIETEQAKQREDEQTKRLAAYCGEMQRRVDGGLNCASCRFGESRGARLFCQNPESYKYEGRHGYGTTAEILCEHYCGVMEIAND